MLKEIQQAKPTTGTLHVGYILYVSWMMFFLTGIIITLFFNKKFKWEMLFYRITEELHSWNNFGFHIREFSWNVCRNISLFPMKKNLKFGPRKYLSSVKSQFILFILISEAYQKPNRKDTKNAHFFLLLLMTIGWQNTFIAFIFEEEKTSRNCTIFQ